MNTTPTEAPSTVRDAAQAVLDEYTAQRIQCSVIHIERIVEKFEALRTALSTPTVPAAEAPSQQLFDIANELHGEFDKQTYDEKRRADFDLADDHEFDVRITAKQERALSQAIIRMERLSALYATLPTEPSSDTPPTERLSRKKDVVMFFLKWVGETSEPIGQEYKKRALEYAAWLDKVSLSSPPPEAQAPSEPTPLDDMRARKDAAYLERNRVVAALASAYPSGIARTAIEGWSEDWNGCVYIDLPTGQASWHYHDSHAHLFEHLPSYQKAWDGHTTEEKYERLAALAALPTLPVSEQDKRDADSASPLLAWILDHPETCAEELDDCAKYGMRGSAVFDALQSRRAALKGEAP